ncbi:hypothetical protein MLD38_028455 [Melastoma candidum]|uniref:Uncharacterized protein n=1 Tax=Melastoma candidum TaxID=119954 RepID=A0ACB9N2V6_9MYRT|nr:hypothetical protein MLD38_028455 [Melastoma candidum]
MPAPRQLPESPVAINLRPHALAPSLLENMEASLTHQDDEFEAEYVLLDLNSVSGSLDIRPNAPYVLSGLDTLNPILVIDNKFKLVGHYVETIGTCIAFSEEDNEEGSRANISLEGSSAVTVDPAPTKQVKPIASMTKILNFRPFIDSETRDGPSRK